MEVTPATEDDVPALSELLGLLFQQEADFRPDPLKQHHFQSENLGVEHTKGGNQCHEERRNWRSRLSPSFERSR